MSDSAIPWTVAYQAPPSVGFFQARVLEWVPFPAAGDLPEPEIKPKSPTLQADALPPEPPEKQKITTKKNTTQKTEPLAKH